MAMVSARLLRLLSTALRDRPPGPVDVVPRGATALLVDIDPPDPPDPRPRAVAAAIAAHERLRAAEGAYAEALAGLDGIAAAEAAQWAGDSRYGDAHSGALRALAAEVAIPTAQNGRTLHQRIGEAGEWARRLPALWAEHCAGALTAAHLRAADRASAHLDGLAADGEPLRDAFERRLLAESVEAAAGGRGTRRTPREFGKLAARIVAEVSPVSVAEDLDRAMAERCVHVQPVAPGMSGLTVVGPTVLVEAAFDRLRAAARALDARDEPRTRAQREVDTAFALLIAGELDAAGGAGAGSVAGAAAADGDAAADGHVGTETDTDAAVDAAGIVGADLVAVLKRIRPVVHLTVPALSLLGHEGAGPAMLDDEHPVPVDVAAVLCGQASQWTRVLTDPLRGVPVAADTYAPGRELRRVLQARDRHCRAPGCAVPARRCDIDHTVEWRRGGRTVPEKLSCLCRYHHVMREFGWGLAQPVPGVLEWTSPGGRVYRTSPSRIAPLGPPVIEPPAESPPGELPPAESPPAEPPPAEPTPAEPPLGERPPGDTSGEPPGDAAGEPPPDRPAPF